MSVLVKRLKKYCSEIGLHSRTIDEVCAGIEQLERKLAAFKACQASNLQLIDDMGAELTAEKGLADRLGRLVLREFPEGAAAYDYRKARGL